MRDFKGNGEVKVASNMLQFFRRQLNDQSYNVSRIYAFKNLFTYSKVIIDSMPYLLYYQFNLDDVYRTYFKSAMVSENLLRTSIRKTPLQKCYELVRGAQSKTIRFNNAFKQFSFLEISLVFDRSDHHLSIYDSYNAEVAATHIKTIKLQNASNTYSEFNTVKFDLEDEED